MAHRVDEHPAWPFRPGRRASLEAARAAFLDAPADGSPADAMLREFIFLGHCFAFLERLIQGEVICDLPVHAQPVLDAAAPDPGRQGELAAETGGSLLGYMPGADDRLEDLLDATGVKVFTLDPDEEAGELVGAFAFDAAVGPALLAGAPARTPAAAFVLAHAYAHLVIDVDPYRPRVCRWDARTLLNRSGRIEELRADRFARALLMPARPFQKACLDLNAGSADTSTASRRIDQLAVLFDVDPTLVAHRLHDLAGEPEAPVPAEPSESMTDAQTPAEASPAASPWAASSPAAAAATAGAPASRLALPERYVNLALAAYAGRVLDLERLGWFLRGSEEEAARVVAWAQVRQEPESEGLDES